MDEPPADRSPLRVAVGAVVENVSSLDAPRPPAVSVEQLLADGPACLRVLIALRRRERVLGGYWELPGGKIEADESPEQAVERELQEELGIAVRPLMRLPMAEHAYDHAQVRLLPFVCCRVEGHPQALDTDAVRWVGLDEVGAYPMPDASLPVIASLRRALGALV